MKFRIRRFGRRKVLAVIEAEEGQSCTAGRLAVLKYEGEHPEARGDCWYELVDAPRARRKR